MAVQPDLSRLKVILLNSGIQNKNNPLYQVILQLIDASIQLQSATKETTSAITGGSTTSISSIGNKTYLTTGNEVIDLPLSRRLLAGANIAFDDTVAGQRTISGSAATPDRSWSVLTNGMSPPELIFAAGDVIMIRIP